VHPADWCAGIFWKGSARMETSAVSHMDNMQLCGTMVAVLLAHLAVSADIFWKAGATVELNAGSHTTAPSTITSSHTMVQLNKDNIGQGKQAHQALARATFAVTF